MKLELYYSDTCRHCRLFNTVVDQVSKERTYVDVHKTLYSKEDHPDIKYIPTVVVSHRGEELGRFSSALAKKDILGWIDQLQDYIKDYLEA